jgi:hypothetical protein
MNASAAGIACSAAPLVIDDHDRLASGDGGDGRLDACKCHGNLLSIVFDANRFGLGRQVGYE